MTAGLFTATSGNVLHFEEHGNSPPLLCLHGIGGGAWFFSEFARMLAKRHRVLTCDLPGTGRSARAEPRRSAAPKSPPTLESWADDLSDFIARHVGEPVILLGHSLGTILALKMWERHPEGIRKMLFVCGLPKVRPDIGEKLAARAAAISRDGIAGWGPKVSPGVFSARSRRERPGTVGDFERLFEVQDPDAYVRSIDNLLAADVRGIVPTVTVPCSAIAGAEDLYAPPDDMREFVSGLPVPCPVKVLEGCAHMPFLEDPAAFVAGVEDLMKNREIQ